MTRIICVSAFADTRSFPSPEIVATLAGQLTAHVTRFTVAFVGCTVAISRSVAPARTMRLPVITTPVAGMPTVTRMDALLFEPSVVRTVIVAVPAFKPCTTPFASTVATRVLLLRQRTGICAVSGVADTCSCADAPTLIQLLAAVKVSFVVLG